jgi:hypothetical protein
MHRITDLDNRIYPHYIERDKEQELREKNEKKGAR